MSAVGIGVLVTTICGAGSPSAVDQVPLHDYASCGVNCLYAACRFCGHDVAFDKVRELLGKPDAAGQHSLEDLQRAGNAAKLHCICTRLDSSAWFALPTPAIVQLRARSEIGRFHFVIVLRLETDRVFILDPPAGHFAMNPSSFMELWTGNAVVVARDEDQLVPIERQLVLAEYTRLAAMLWVSVTVLALFTIVLVSGGARLRLGARWTHLTQSLATKMCRPSGKVLVTIAAIGIIVWLIGSNRNAQAGPWLTAQSELIDLGELDLGEHPATVAIRNSGTTSLVLRNVRSTCTCATAASPVTIIAPDQSVDVPIKILVGKGPRAARLEFESNDPRGTKRITISWRGRPSCQLVPPTIHVTETSSTAPLLRTVQVLYHGGLAVAAPEIVCVESDTQWIRVATTTDTLRFGPDAGNYDSQEYFGAIILRVQVDAPTQNEVSEVNGRVTVHIKNSGRSTRVSLPVIVRFVPDSVKSVGQWAPVVFSSKHGPELIGQKRVRGPLIDPGDVAILETDKHPSWLTLQRGISHRHRRNLL